MRESGQTLVKGLGITKGLKVLDLGCGDGTTALPEARLGADVLGVDIATNLVEAGNKRAKEQGLTNCKFQEGDASNLHELKDRSFDLVVSIFGAMFAPKPFDVAKEMVRVTLPGGRIVMGNWIPNDPTLVAQILKISSAYSPPPPEGFISPMTWGIEKDVIERFGGARRRSFHNFLRRMLFLPERLLLWLRTGAGQGASGPLGTTVTVCRSLWRRFLGVWRICGSWLLDRPRQRKFTSWTMLCALKCSSPGSLLP